MLTNSLRFFFFDVQHGNATYIQTPNDKHIMVDLGTGSLKRDQSVFSPLMYIRTKWHVRQLDLVIITHPHRDHLDDIWNFGLLQPKILLRPTHLTAEDILSNNQPKDNPTIQKYLAISNNYNQPAPSGLDLGQPANFGGVAIKHFIPLHCPKDNLNNHSIVTIFEYNGVKVVIPGDNEDRSWKELLTNNHFVNAVSNADVLLASHHGRNAGFCEDLFRHMTPRLTIISDGPSGNTSVTSKYFSNTSGWKVMSRSTGVVEDRRCLTTRYDKGIDVTISHNGVQPTLNATII